MDRKLLLLLTDLKRLGGRGQVIKSKSQLIKEDSCISSSRVCKEGNKRLKHFQHCWCAPPLQLLCKEAS